MKQKKNSKHHRKCQSNGGGDELKNLSFVQGRKHQAWHKLFENWEAPRIAKEINDIWIDPRWELVARLRK